MTSQAMKLTRRRLLAAAPLSTLLAACGGSGADETNTPTIQEFALASPVLVGERASLRVRYSGGAGRIEPGLGAVASGTTVQTPALARGQRYRLVVSAPGAAEVSRELAVEPGWRNRLRSFEAPSMTGQAVVALGDGRVLVFGGSTSGSQPPFAELVDTRTGTASPGGWMMLPRHQHAALRLADGRVAAIGGSRRNSIELWTPASNTWALACNRMAHVREHATASLLPGSRVLIVDGYAEVATHSFAEVFDPANQTFTPVAHAPEERRWLHAALTLADGSVLVVGGENETGALASGWRFDVATQRFVALAPLTSARSVVRAVATPDDELLLYGGEQEADGGLASGVALRAGAQRALPDMPTPRAWQSLTRLSDGRLLLLGGQHRSGFVGGGMLYD